MLIISMKIFISKVPLLLMKVKKQLSHARIHKVEEATSLIHAKARTRMETGRVKEDLTNSLNLERNLNKHGQVSQFLICLQKSLLETKILNS
jgi:hypothetical protein